MGRPRQSSSRGAPPISGSPRAPGPVEALDAVGPSPDPRAALSVPSAPAGGGGPVPRRIAHGGRSLTLAEWAAELGVSRQALEQRLARYPIAVALDPAFERPTQYRVRGVTYGGRTQTQAAWAAELGITPSTLCRRIQRWGVERALSTPRSGS